MKCVIFASLFAPVVEAGAKPIAIHQPSTSPHSASMISSGTAEWDSSSAAKLEIDLSNLRVDQGHAVVAGQGKMGYHIMNTSLHGTEIACLNCDEALFDNWLQQVGNLMNPDCDKSAFSKAVSGGKHPNSPGYDEWRKQQKLGKSANFLSAPTDPTPSAGDPCEGSAVSITHDHGWDLASKRPLLQTLWSQRRLVVGQGPDPLHPRMNFVEALESLARKSPALTPADCDRNVHPHCDALLSGKRTASGDELRHSLEESFGVELLQKHEYKEGMNETEQRSHVQALLTALKTRYSFYYQKCLNHEEAAATCNAKASSQILGRISCRPEDDEPSDDCVFAEVRLCEDCGPKPKFFEYSRLHGPLALFATDKERNAVMGQCEEFSRAGHALLASSGYAVRYVLDFTDHVWVEVQMPKGEQGKWIHADPSEGVLDSPLMYEEGWGKQLTMIFAFTPQKVEHVTRTYTKQYEETIGRRGVSEEDLNAAIAETNRRLNFELPMRPFGYTFSSSDSSKDRTLEEVALWSHFDGSP